MSGPKTIAPNIRQVYNCQNEKCDKIRWLTITVDDNKAVHVSFNLNKRYRIYIDEKDVKVWIFKYDIISSSMLMELEMQDKGYPKQINLPPDRFEWFNTPIKTIKECVDALLLLS
jgi:hypothetical protein